MTMPFTGGMSCPCTETWDAIPSCEGETEQRYAYGLWVHPECVQHVEHLRSMQETIKELRGDDAEDAPCKTCGKPWRNRRHQCEEITHEGQV